MSLEHKKRGIKRKREDVQVDLHQKISGKLYHGLREAKHAAKKAKTFETQKLVKRLKTTKSSEDAAEVSKLEGQLKELKEADHERLCTMAFFSKLKKDKVLSRHPDFQTAFEAERTRTAPATTSGLSPQLESRLLSSKALSAGINSIITSLRAIIAPPASSAEGDGTDEEDEENVQPTEPTERPRKAAKLADKSTPAASKANPVTPVAHDDETWSEDEEPVGEDDEIPDAGSEHVVDDDGWESGSVDEDGNINHGSDDDSDSDSSQSSALPSAPAATTKSKPAESVFLPSLAVGYTRGDSDSDFSDSEAKVADSVRKNRRGQRARRAIWEKKYGKGAKHLNKGLDGDVQQGSDGPRQRAGERQGPRQRDNGRDSRPGRPPQTNASWPPRSDAIPRHQRPAQPYHSMPQSNGPPPPPRRMQKPAEEKPLHPSWEAKKRLKEQQSASIRPPTGTKIKFDD